MRRLIPLFLIALLFRSSPVKSNSQDSITKPDPALSKKKAGLKALGFTSVYYGTSIVVLSNTWYRNKRTVPFHVYNDTKHYLQVDKLGHAFGAYIYSYIGYHYLVNSGYSRNESLYFGATLGLLLQIPIEIMDGVHEGYGFSPGDMAANTCGSVLVLGQALLFNEQLVKYKFSYWESNYSRNSNGFLGENTLNRILKDYNGQNYWLSFPINKITRTRTIPDWLNIAFGYGANGMYGEVENVSSYKGVSIPSTIRYRQYLMSLDIDWTKIKTRSKTLRHILKGLTFVKLPSPAIEYNSLGNFKGYWIYY
jgi:hypothetical protein